MIVMMIAIEALSRHSSLFAIPIQMQGQMALAEEMSPLMPEEEAVFRNFGKCRQVGSTVVDS